MLTDTQWADARAAFGLTPRVFDVVQCAFDTGHRPYIARALGIALKTVDMHLGEAFRKIRVDDRGDMILAILARVEDRTNNDDSSPKSDTPPPGE